MLILIILFLALIFALGIFFWQLSNLISVFFGCLYVSGGRDIIEESLNLVKLKKGEVFYDLGCGKGDALVAAAGLGAKAVGYEISPYYYLWSKIRSFFWNIKSKLSPKIRSSVKSGKTLVRYKNIKSVDLAKADVVYCYLLPEFLEKLAGKFKKELKYSARLISISFKIPKLKLVQKTKFQGKTIFIYSP